MSKFLLVLILIIFSQLPLYAVNVNTVVLREWDNGKNIEYLEYTNNNRRGNLSTYTVKTVYSEIQDDNAPGNYDITISKFISTFLMHWRIRIKVKLSVNQFYLKISCLLKLFIVEF